MAGDAPILRLSVPFDGSLQAARSPDTASAVHAQPVSTMLPPGVVMAALVVILLPMWMIASFRARRAATKEPGVRRRRLGAGRPIRIEATEAPS